MKRIDLVRKIEELGCELVRHGGRHDWYRNPQLVSPSQCRVIERLKNLSHATSSKC